MVSGDLLGAASLALGALSALYVLWSPQIDRALELPKATHKDDRSPAIKELRRALRRAALPLVFACSAVLLVLFPPMLSVVGSAGQAVARDGLVGSFANYDAVGALFLCVWLFSAALLVVLVSNAVRLRKRVKEFESAG